MAVEPAELFITEIQPGELENLSQEDQIIRLGKVINALIRELKDYTYIKKLDQDAIINSVNSYTSSPGEGTLWYDTSASAWKVTDPSGTDKTITVT